MFLTLCCGELCEGNPEGGYFVEPYKLEKYVDLPEYDGPRHVFHCNLLFTERRSILMTT
jgi:hypothetical protein